LQDPVFLRHRSESAGERNIDIRVAPADGGVRVTVAREKTVDVPAFAKVAVGSTNRAVENTLWRSVADGWAAEYTIEVSGLPVKARGRSSLKPCSRGCLYTSTFEVIANIPLIGKRLEALVADGLEEQLKVNIQRNVEGLARGTNRGPHSYIAALKNGGASTANGT
jgi:hypothetical protein